MPRNRRGDGSDRDPNAPVEIAGYSGLTEVGRGGFAVVYRARDERFARDVAIKVIAGGLDASGRERFLRECAAVGSLSGHPNIVSVHDAGAAGAATYLVMEYLPGGTLTDRAAGRALPWSEAIGIGVTLAGALESAHRIGVLHRDVKPENVLFSSFGTAKLVDFGIAAVGGGYETRSATVTASLSHAAPEVIAGQRATATSDVYSLASTVYFALAGSAAFSSTAGETLVPLIARISTAPVPDLRPLGVPEQVAAAVERGMAKDPAARPATAESFAAELRDAAAAAGTALAPPVLAAAPAAGAPVAGAPAVGEATQVVGRRREVGESTPQPVPAPAGGRPRRGMAFAAAGLALVLGGGGAAFAVTRGGEPGPSAPAQGATGDIAATDPAVTANGLRVARAYAIRDGRVGSTTVLTNTTDKAVTQIWPEVVPKELALDVAFVSFSPAPSHVVDADPIVYWELRIPAGARRTIAWTTALPAAGTASAAYLDQVVGWHRAAVERGSATVDAALREAERAGAGEGVKASDTVAIGPTKPAVQQPPVQQPPAKTTTPKANRAPVLSVSDRSDDELESVSFKVAASDPDGNAVTVRVSNLPAGISSDGARIQGRLSHSAASVTTDRREGLMSRSFNVSVTATDSKGARTSRTFTWTVRDTHRTMPSYVGTLGCGGCQNAPDVAAVSSPNFGCDVDPQGDGDHITRQSVSPGTVIRWGQAVTYWYGRPAC